MPNSKNDFLTRINNFDKIVSTQNANEINLISKALTEVEHNEKVKMLRNGIAIIGFTILEDFIKRRTGEIFKEIGNTGVSFSSLPKKLKEVSTLGALKGIQSRAELLKKAPNSPTSYTSFIQQETKFVASTSDSVYELSEYSIGWDKSNLSSNDISNFLKVFCVSNGWNSIQNISSIINCTLTNPNEIFNNAAQRRHKAAHNINADSLLSDLISFVSDARVIALAYDVLLNKSLSYLKNNNNDFLNENIKTKPSDISFRFIIEVGNKWKEYKQNTTRAFRVKNNLTVLESEAKQRAQDNDEVLVIKSSNNQIIRWHT